MEQKEIKIIANAIIEKERYGRLCPETIKKLEDITEEED